SPMNARPGCVTLGVAMDDAPILICYDDSKAARRGIGAAAALFSQRCAVLPDVAPPVTVGESYASLGAITPKSVGMNADEALSRARIGAGLALDAGLAAEARAAVDATTWD